MILVFCPVFARPFLRNQFLYNQSTTNTDTNQYRHQPLIFISILIVLSSKIKVAKDQGHHICATPGAIGETQTIPATLTQPRRIELFSANTAFSRLLTTLQHTLLSNALIHSTADHRHRNMGCRIIGDIIIASFHTLINHIR